MSCTQPDFCSESGYLSCVTENSIYESDIVVLILCVLKANKKSDFTVTSPDLESIHCAGSAYACLANNEHMSSHLG